MKMGNPWCCLLLALLVSGVTSEDDTSSDTCSAPGLWGELLEEWATTAHDARHGRVMALPPTKGYYVTDRIDGPLTPPPPPPHGAPYGPPTALHGPPPYGHNSHGTNGPHSGHGQSAPQGPPTAPHGAPLGAPQYPPPANAGYSQYDEWKATPPPPPGAGKIVNRPPNPYKDKFKPSYQLPNQPVQQPIPVTHPWAADRVDAAAGAGAPQKHVSETDLYLLSAIEKLVYRADLMEKRLRRLEDSVHYLVAGKEVKPEPCAGNFTRVGGGCYLVSSAGGDWKAASLRCRKLRAHLLELGSADERRALFSLLLSHEQYKGEDFWTGGLNPGLLWIWSHSAAPLNGTTDTVTVTGAGRCLALAHDAGRATYLYRGHDCALTHRFICELPEDREKVSNEIDRAARALRDMRSTARQARQLLEKR